MDHIGLEDSWKVALAQEFEQPYMGNLRSFLDLEHKEGRIIYPRGSEIFRAFELTPLGRVKVVILGQDPYHGPGQAHGLSFSVQEGIRPPPSLLNIFKELRADIKCPIPTKGDLTAWAKQGVLLLNSVLTVREGAAASHRGQGWERFTDSVIQILGARSEPTVFILWGAFAQSKRGFIRVPPHGIISSAHPSPLSAHNGFLGSRPFSKANEMLLGWGKEPIDWASLEKEP
jgi:uracil-DNA glycosylase